MSLDTSLEMLERFSAKTWRKYANQDPISQLSFNEYDYLKVIQLAKEPLRLTDLADEMRVSKPSASNMVKRLEKKGLVTRVECSEDARSKRIKVTEHTLEVLEVEAIVYREIAQQVSRSLTVEESDILSALLAKALR
ncbi:MarR family winged helix-turn-helix transcriptional regulator [Vibrio sonorensis]|uniref:MarR family winged helix-turn-helix transcriptional regulator n=1 Tax=Vibrio sonorensis TaxID=1004316 RepID=UPI0008D95FE6|nr:MarR family transcriptional regulator [Vibrio sonorensis]